MQNKAEMNTYPRLDYFLDKMKNKEYDKLSNEEIESCIPILGIEIQEAIEKG